MLRSVQIEVADDSCHLARAFTGGYFSQGWDIEVPLEIFCEHDKPWKAFGG